MSAWCTAALLFIVATACSDNDNPPSGSPPGAAIPPSMLDPGESLPGVNVELLRVSGASGADGSFQVGDRVTVALKITDDTGAVFAVDQLDRASAYISGPTFNYNRVIPAQSDVLDVATQGGDGTIGYSFPPLPAVYAAPYNDSPDNTIGELTDTPLLAGTYTVGFEFRRDYRRGSDTLRDVDNASADFRFGGAAALEKREVVSQANCTQCHGEMAFHGDNRTDVTNCLLCHTSGAEDRDGPGGTPGATIDFKVMIHKIHTGKHLPSVLGVTTEPDGTRQYDATPEKYRLVGFGNSVHDYSGIAFPVWPSLVEPMPEDTGYGSLSPTERNLEDSMRSGPVSCDKCHGDPDGAGPLPPPAQGDLIHTQPTRVACGSCHEDWVWERPYTANMQTMPAQSDDAACTLCHKASGTALDVIDAHRHPLVDPQENPGTNFELLAVDEAGGDADGRIEVDEKIRLSFKITDDAGNDIAPAGLIRGEVVIAGPSENPQQILWTSLPTAALSGGGTHVMNAPEQVFYEFIRRATGGIGETFGTQRMPHWDVAGAETFVLVRTASGAATTLAANAPALQNYIDVAPGMGSLFTRNEFIVLEDGIGGQEEYLQIQYVDSDRLWFSSPAARTYAPHVRVAHAAGAAVRAVTLTLKTATVDYMLDATNGIITTKTDFGAGNPVLVWYTTDFIVPSNYAGTVNQSPALDESWGHWLGKSMVPGTYTVGIWAARPLSVNRFGQVTSYNDAAEAATKDFLLGSTASELEPSRRIDSAASCLSCHDNLVLHGSGRAGYNGCVLCHLAGAEDRPPYIAANAPQNEVTIDFRTMIHKIHQGKELAKADTYRIAGFGLGYPNNFSLIGYQDVGYPFQPGFTANCASCHGAGNTAWQEPADRSHPTEQTLPVREWRAACNSCHDSNAATAHVDANTSPSGAESCAICHGPGELVDVEVAHR